MNIPFIKGDGIYLRELRDSDLDGHWYAWFNDSTVTTYQNKKIFPNSREKQKQYYESLSSSSTDVVLAIVEESTEKHIGNVGLHHIDWVHRSAELGIVIGEKEFWGKGYGRQAWSLISSYGFESLNLHRIYAIVATENGPSRKCAEDCGFKKEGEIRDVFYKNGRYLSVIYYNLIHEETGR